MSAVIFSVLKFAVLPEPSATMLLAQFPGVLQSSPEVVVFHVPLCAVAIEAVAAKSRIWSAKTDSILI